MASLKLSLCMLLLLAATLPAMSMPAGARPGMKSLAARLQAEGTQQCWESLMELRSCTGEIILFFLNGEAYLGPGCCQAIRVIKQHCWAADTMLAAIGFTPQEGDILKGYCDAEDGEQPGTPQTPPPREAAPGPALDGIGARKNLVH